MLCGCFRRQQAMCCLGASRSCRQAYARVLDSPPVSMPREMHLMHHTQLAWARALALTQCCNVVCSSVASVPSSTSDAGVQANVNAVTLVLQRTLRSG